MANIIQAAKWMISGKKVTRCQYKVHFKDDYHISSDDDMLILDWNGDIATIDVVDLLAKDWEIAE